MRSLRFGLLLVFLIFPTVSALAQSANGVLGLPQTPPPGSVQALPWTPHVVRDPQAIAAVQASIAALGGAAAIGNIQNCVVQGDVSAAPGSLIPNGEILYEVSGTESKSAFTSPQRNAAQISGNGQPYRVVDGVAKKSPPHVLRASFFAPLVAKTLLREFQDANYSVEYKGSTTIGSSNVTVVQTASQANLIDSVVTPQTWYFDNSTNLPVRVEYRLPNDSYPKRGARATTDLSAYRSVSGVLYPFQSATSIVSKPVDVVSISTVVPNGTISPAEFAVPAGGLQ